MARPALCPQRDCSIAEVVRPADVLRRLNVVATVLAGPVHSYRRDHLCESLARLRGDLGALLPYADPLADRALGWTYDAVRDALALLEQPEPDYAAVADAVTAAIRFAGRWHRLETRR